jgi:hypothetical protein
MFCYFFDTAHSLIWWSLIIYTLYRAYSFRVNAKMATSEDRRRIQLANDFDIPDSVAQLSEYVLVPADWNKVDKKADTTEYVDHSGKGCLVFTRCVRPKSSKQVKAIIFFCHGYLDHSHSFVLQQVSTYASVYA